MYFFYIDESGTRDPETETTKADGTVVPKDHLYVLTAVGLFERKWRRLEQMISNVKLDFIDRVKKRSGREFELADCEVKSTWLRLPKLRRSESPFLDALEPDELLRLSEVYFEALGELKAVVIAVVIDKRHIRSGFDHLRLHLQAYEMLLERIEDFIAEYHAKHLGLIVIDDTDKSINRSLAMRHARFQREGNRFSRFHHIVEYPFFTDSRLSTGIQLADLVGYNIYRAFRNQDFDYAWFQKVLPRFHASQKTRETRLDGLYVWPSESPLVEFLTRSVVEAKQKQPTLWEWAESRKR